jgi:multiple antibiotic resistance protein
LKDALWLEKILGEGILHVLRKVFGLILLAISAKLFSENAVWLFT